ncbi:MAG: esterase [Hydrocarboniphaga sp.]|uniref:alpha/beta hydrolase n=1 Tax=Hydrocarboniphaga sp. TaxID=2033016 RepID=UPI002613F97B|nr:alpha/beta hydrolase-fold protein [Hydrocarboniphaga sp.]MDB5972603.1 esterase [Hydrocarboniphaga sp.]
MSASLRILLSLLLLSAIPYAAAFPFGSKIDDPKDVPKVTTSAPSAQLIGQTFTIESKVMHETRRINVYTPPPCDGPKAAACPVLYMPDGGILEDFLHIAGLVQVSVGNHTMRPFILVGIENTERRRDLTPPTDVAEDLRIAPRVGGSALFRQFLRDELKVAVRARYNTSSESAIVGESLAGLFIVETFLLEPDLFDSYIAISPSLWWNGQQLADSTAARLKAQPDLHKTLYLSAADESNILPGTQVMAAALKADAPKGLRWYYEPMPGETHATIYHPAALAAFRKVFAPAATP